MSHELRSPLNAILGFTELALRNPELSPPVKEDLITVAKNGEHLYTLINQVLDLSKVEAGHASLNEVNFNLYDLLEELTETFSLTAKRKGLQLTLEIEPEVPQYVRTDMVKLRQVLINLMNNSLKFTREGGVILRVDTVKTNGIFADNSRLSFAVIDSGPGIAPEELAKLGEAFMQAAAGRESREGTGLGLALSRSFIQLMGGELCLSSELGRGTTIALTASSVEEDRDYFLSIGCDDFLRKPFREEVLFDLLHQHLQVEFLFEQAAPEASVEIPDKARLAILSTELRSRLKGALAELDDNGIANAIADIEKQDAKLAEGLLLLVNGYNYRLLASLLEGV